MRLAPTYFSPEKGAALINDMPVYAENWFAAGGIYSTIAALMKRRRNYIRSYSFFQSVSATNSSKISCNL